MTKRAVACGGEGEKERKNGKKNEMKTEDQTATETEERRGEKGERNGGNMDCYK